mgnify:CR=1 FL=1
MRFFLFLFFCLHILAVSVAAIPRHADDPFSRTVRSVWSPLSHPYVTLTGQWQNWGLFAPDPLERAIEYHIDVVEGQMRIGTITLGPDSILRRRRTNLLKIMRQMWKEGEDYKEARRQFLLSLCSRWHLPKEAGLRLRVQVNAVRDPSKSVEVNDVSVLCSQRA